MTHWFLHFFGIEPRQTSTAYNFWSGFGSDLGEVTLIGVFVAGARHVNCHEKGCWRLGPHVQVDAEGHHIRRCHKHHREATGR